MYNKFTNFLKDKNRICIIQAENPDGDSLGSALAIEEILSRQPHPPMLSLYCPVSIPKYLYYIAGADRVTTDFDFTADGYIIVDTAAAILLSKLLDDPATRNRLYEAPVLVIDHHETPDDIDFPHDSIIEPLPSCTNLIYKICSENANNPDNLNNANNSDSLNNPNNSNSLNNSGNSSNSGIFTITPLAAELLLAGLLSDTLGLSTESVSADTFRTVAELVDHGASVAELENKRRDFMKKSQRILAYKARLIDHVEYFLDGLLATVHIPWEEISEYSDEYNPGVLIIDELRMVEGVGIAIAIKTYPDGKLTGKIRSDLPLADTLAGYFGGGGHPYAAGFRTYDTTYSEVVADLIRTLPKLIADLPPESLAKLTPAQRNALGLDRTPEPAKPSAGNGIRGLEGLVS